ncbi:MAG TPA: hypothetical protein VGI81_17755 [Tepidisphaeraceae bacterium]|jgi:hypothetical protein
MNARFVIVCVAMLVVFASAASYGKPPAAAAPSKDVDELEMQVAAMTKLHDLDLTASQLKQLKALAAQVEPAKAPAAGLSTDAYKTALTALRDALAGDDDDKIDAAQDRVDSLREHAKLEDVPDPEITDSARKQASAAASLLTATQIASYIAANEDDVSDPLEEMTDALDQLADNPGSDEYASIRSELISEVAPLVAGLDKSAEEPIAKKVGEWLDAAHAGGPSKLESDRASYERSARQIVGKLDPYHVLRNWMQREMATLLSNPALPAAIDRLIPNAGE